jgi:ornithine carbamoyltransferase
MTMTAATMTPARTARHLLSIRDLDDDDLHRLVERGVELAARRGRVPERPLRDRVVGIYFRKTSTRTRTGFSAGALRLGATIVSFGPDDLQENTGETVEDTGRVLSGMLDGLVARTTGSMAELRALADQPRMGVINAMSAAEHPTQALADLVTMRRRFGRVEGLRVLYVGEGNNTAAALALALARYQGTSLQLRTPPGYGLAAEVLAAADDDAGRRGAEVVEGHDMALPGTVDVVYTTRWQTTGTTKADPDWRAAFAPFRVDRRLMARFPGAVFMHDLPAHRGDEVDAEVLDGPASVAFEQAENKLYSAMAALEWCVPGVDGR